MSAFNTLDHYISAERVKAILDKSHPEKAVYVSDIVRNYYSLLQGRKVLFSKIGLVTSVRDFLGSIQKEYELDFLTAMEITNSMTLPKRLQ